MVLALCYFWPAAGNKGEMANVVLVHGAWCDGAWR